MDLTISYGFLLCISLSCVLAQVFVRDKKPVHLFFAIFCGSIAMMSAQQLSHNTSANMFFLFGLGACATCNGYWLVARSLFRQQNPVAPVHVIFASAVAALVVLKKSFGQMGEMIIANSSATSALNAVAGELLVFMSSTMMVLTIWEGIRNWSALQNREKNQRRLFLFTILGSILTVTIFGSAAETAGFGSDIKTLLIPFAASTVIIFTQVLIIWRFARADKKTSNTTSFEKLEESATPHELQADTDIAMARQIKCLLIEQQLYLQFNLKVSDVARRLDVSEYLVSKTVRLHFDGKNFNQLINQLRVKHAKKLLEDPVSSQWPVMVVGLESGFASVGPFSRAFKDIVGETPGRYRRKAVS